MHRLTAAGDHRAVVTTQCAAADRALGRVRAPVDAPAQTTIARQGVTERDILGFSRSGIVDRDREPNRVSRTYRTRILSLRYREVRTLHRDRVRARVVSSVGFVAG